MLGSPMFRQVVSTKWHSLPACGYRVSIAGWKLRHVMSSPLFRKTGHRDGWPIDFTRIQIGFLTEVNLIEPVDFRR